MENSTEISIVIPAYNEEASISNVLDILTRAKLPQVREIIVVDDGSFDNTSARTDQFNITLLQHKLNKGYGASLKSGITHASTPYILIMDADGQHRLEDIHKLLAEYNQYEMVIGARENLVHSPLWRMPGKWVLTIMANYITQQKIPDLNSGLRIFQRNVILKYLGIFPDGFSFSTTSTIAFLKMKHATKFIPIRVNKRIGKSTVRISTGLHTIILILRLATLFDPLRIFLPLSMVIGIGSILWGVPYFLIGNGVSGGALLGLVTTVLLFSIGLLSDQISQLRLGQLK